MHVIVMWSGEDGRAFAAAVQKLIKDCFGADVEVFVSQPPEKGASFRRYLFQALAKADLGVLCLTRESQRSSWVAFECGAVMKSDSGRVLPLLFDEGVAVPPPLDMFAKPFDASRQVGCVEMLRAINGDLARSVQRDYDEIYESLRSNWQLFERVLNSRYKALPAVTGIPADLGTLLAATAAEPEDVALVRSVQQRINGECSKPADQQDFALIHQLAHVLRLLTRRSTP